MKLCNETITLFNAKLDTETGYDAYVPTVIKGVSFYCDIASTVDSSGLKAANKFTIRIPMDADFSGKAYVAPTEYADADSAGAFTFAQGDIIIKGEETDITVPSELKKKYSEYVTILGVIDNRRSPNAKHWRVVGS